MKKAIVVVSFGTTYDDTRAKTLEVIEKSIEDEFSDYYVTRAYTSSIVLKRLKARGFDIQGIEECLESLEKYEEVILQPTHIIAGYEYEKILKATQKFKNKFNNIVIGKPLLYNEEDYNSVSSFINTNFGSFKGKVLLMGHGSDHSSDEAYKRLQGLLNENIYIATVEGSITFEDIKTNLENERVLLAPFMIVCGDHGNNDMAGSEDSWKAHLEEVGCTVSLSLKGLGEYEEIRSIFISHTKEAIYNLGS